MSGFWAVFWLAVVLKIPICLLLYIVWWAAKDPPDEWLADDEDGGSRRDGPHPRLRPPNPPRRGPHAEPAPPARARVRVSGRPAGLPERPA